jgi:hypothetical protein
MFSSIITFACKYQPPTRRAGCLQQSEGSQASISSHLRKYMSSSSRRRHNHTRVRGWRVRARAQDCLCKRATHPHSTDVRQVTQKPRPPTQHLVVHFGRLAVSSSGDDDASSHRHACKVLSCVMHGRIEAAPSVCCHRASTPRTMTSIRQWDLLSHRGRRSGRHSSRIHI